MRESTAKSTRICAAEKSALPRDRPAGAGLKNFAIWRRGSARIMARASTVVGWISWRGGLEREPKGRTRLGVAGKKSKRKLRKGRGRVVEIVAERSGGALDS